MAWSWQHVLLGLARDRRQRDDRSVFQIYASGCSGDVTAGKYNDGSTGNRAVLADRLYQGMQAAWENTRRMPLERAEFRSAPLWLDFHQGPEFTADAMQKTLADPDAATDARILAALGLSSRRRLERDQPIDVPCIDFGSAQLVVLPGEAFVGYQLMAQAMRPDSAVMCLGYGESWTGYIPTTSAFEEGFGHGWRWVAEGAEPQIRAALHRVLQPE